MAHTASASRITEIRKNLNALTHEARLLLNAAEDPAFTMTALDATALADLIIDRSAAILAALEAPEGVRHEG